MTPALLRRWRPPALALPSWPWRITWTYLGLILFLPLGAMLLRAAEVGPAGFWEMATTPEAIATYKVSFGLALVASVINGVFGLVVAWALVRCRFQGQRLLDALIDLPFALPTAVAGLALTAVYSTNGWLGQPTTPSHTHAPRPKPAHLRHCPRLRLSCATDARVWRATGLAPSVRHDGARRPTARTPRHGNQARQPRTPATEQTQGHRHREHSTVQTAPRFQPSTFV